MLPQLSIDWPNLKGVNKKFWKAQWDKHGSCSQFKQSYYFQYAMNLRAMDNLTSILEVEVEPPCCHPGVAAARVMCLYHTNGSRFSMLELRDEDSTQQSLKAHSPTKHSPPLSFPSRSLLAE
ncbi:ribonuclease [Trifolium repens]|nr:ribonuclease [Trifolium repens]